LDQHNRYGINDEDVTRGEGVGRSFARESKRIFVTGARVIPDSADAWNKNKREISTDVQQISFCESQSILKPFNLCLFRVNTDNFTPSRSNLQVGR
jgi:hypothetical protein